jgi:hypothetical protein
MRSATTETRISWNDIRSHPIIRIELLSSLKLIVLAIGAAGHHAI